MSVTPHSAETDDLSGYYQQNQRVFGWLAPYYDAIALLVAPLRRRVVAFAELPPGSRVLDVATGTGAQALAFARQGYRVVGIDLVEEMLEVARRKPGSDAVHFERMDATRLSIPDRSFDASTVSFGLHDMPPQVRAGALAEMVRVTRPGAPIVIVDYGLPQHRLWRWLAVAVISSWERGWYKQFVHADLLALLREAGIVLDAQRSAWFGAVRLLRGHVRQSP
jgi:ubiquinone/menaquinone biosynthesis C-methylase UbiE